MYIQLLFQYNMKSVTCCSNFNVVMSSVNYNDYSFEGARLKLVARHRKQVIYFLAVEFVDRQRKERSREFTIIDCSN